MLKKTEQYPHKFLLNPNPDKTKEEMWDILDGWTQESVFEKFAQEHTIDIYIPFPPLKYQNKILKGLFFSQATDKIVERFPKIKEIFFPIANSMFSGYPQSEYADYYFVCYKNPEREKRWKKLHPDKKDVILLPLQDADWTNEYEIAPKCNIKKNTDIFCVTTPYSFKNMPMFASAIKLYEKKYNYRLKVKYAIGLKEVIKNDDGTIDYSMLRYDLKIQLDKVIDILGENYNEYIDFYPWINREEISDFYTSAKCSVLCSLIEGKNRFIQEAQSCNIPVIVFSDHNKFAKGEHPIVFEGSGELALKYTPESLADAIHKVINNQQNYHPRENYLKYSGRKNFINTIIDMSPYYRENIPNYKPNDIQNNLWIDLAIQDNYETSFIDFLYGRKIHLQAIRGLDNIGRLVEFYYSKFGLIDNNF